MTARLPRLIVAAGLLLVAGACGTGLHEVSIETPLKPKLDTSPFRRVLVAGFVAGGSQDVDANLETVRLLRSQLRNQSEMQVVETDVLSLAELVAGEMGEPEDVSGLQAMPLVQPDEIAEEADLQAYERVFADVGFWRQLGEEHQSPLIITGTILFRSQARAGFVTREQETYDSFGRRRVQPIRTYRERNGYVLSPKFIFIDGRTGITLYTESHREEILYEAEQNTPALSSYFELMDRLLPTFLSALSTQTIRGSRMLIR